MRIERDECSLRFQITIFVNDIEMVQPSFQRLLCRLLQLEINRRVDSLVIRGRFKLRLGETIDIIDKLRC